MEDEKFFGKIGCIGAVAVVVVLLLCFSFYHVSPGHRGVMVTMGKVSPTSYANGVGFKWPFISKMVSMDTRTKTLSGESSTYTSDIQSAEIKYTLTYNLNPANVNVLYETVGKEYEGKIITPVLYDVIKDVIGKWQAQELVANRDKARHQIMTQLANRVNSKFIENITFQITNIDYSDNFEKAIEDKVIAEQKAQQAVNNTKRIKEEADQKVIAAQAESEAMRIKTEALSRDKSLIDYEAVQKWDGKLPTYMMGNSMPFINLK